LRVNFEQKAGKHSFAVDDMEVSVNISKFKGDSEIGYLPMLPSLAASSAEGAVGSLQIFPTTSSLSGNFLNCYLNTGVAGQLSYVMQCS
jgi:hypothetical protein